MQKKKKVAFCLQFTLKRSRYVYIRIIVNFKKNLLWTQLLKFCLDSFEPHFPPPHHILPFSGQISDNSIGLMHVLREVFLLWNDWYAREVNQKNAYVSKPNIWQPPEKEVKKVIPSVTTATRTLILSVLLSGL